MIAVSPDRPEELAESKKANDLGYRLYSDSKMNAARALGIAFQVDRGTRTKYRLFGIDLGKASGEEHGQLPVPSVFLVAPGGEILWVYSNPDYKIRPENDAVLNAARAHAEQGAADETAARDAGGRADARKAEPAPAS